MGIVRAQILLKNSGDVLNSRRGIIKESEIRKADVTVIVDTGAISLVINEEVRQKLGLEIMDLGYKYNAKLADGSSHSYDLTEPVEINWKNRMTTCHAILIPNASNILLGAIPLEGMDLEVNPKKQELVGIHGDEPTLILF